MGKNLVINGVNYNDVSEVHIPQQNSLVDAVFYDTSGATAESSQVLYGIPFINSNGSNTGTMRNVGAQIGTISSVNGTANIQQGFHNGSGFVGIDAVEAAKIISSNIRKDVSILGVVGSPTVVDTHIRQENHPAHGGVILNGYTAYVDGVLVEGHAQVPAVAQDSVTKILTIT